MVEKYTLNSLATALVDLTAVSMPIVLCEKLHNLERPLLSPAQGAPL